MDRKQDRKQLSRAYRDTPRQMGVFRIHNRSNGRALIGTSVDLPAMLNRHRAQLNMGVHPDKVLQSDWNQLGADSFEFEIVDTLDPTDEPGYNPAADLQVLAEMWLQRLAPHGDPGYTARARAQR